MDNDFMNFFHTKNNFSEIADKESFQIFGTRVQRPFLSIMIPTYKRPHLIAKTIQSVVNQKTDINYEVVIVDNNDDATDISILNIVKKYSNTGICYYRNSENLGMFGNWNRCLELANADWVLILHDDDTIEPNYVEEMMKIAKTRATGMIACCHNTIDLNSNELRPSPKDWLVNKFLGNGKILEISVKDLFFTHTVDIVGTLLNKKCAMDLGGFDPCFTPYGDHLFMINMISLNGGCLYDMRLINYRWSENESLKISTQLKNIFCECLEKKYINQQFHFFSKSFEINFSTAHFHARCAKIKKRKDFVHDISSEDFENKINEMIKDFEIGRKTKLLCLYRCLEIGYWFYKVIFCFRKFPTKRTVASER